MDTLEAATLAEATDWTNRHATADHRFTAVNLCQWHKQWLGAVYEWAGEYRQVNISKGGFPFAMSAQVPHLMQVFERDVLARYTPCAFDDPEKVLEALAITYCELVLIHPFREGNGRVALAFHADGVAGRVAATNFWRHQGQAARGLLCRGAGWNG